MNGTDSVLPVHPQRPPTSTLSTPSYSRWGLQRTMTGNQCSVCSGWQSAPACVVSFISLLEEKQPVLSFAPLQYERNKLIKCMKIYRIFQQDRGEKRLNAYYLCMQACHIVKDLPGYFNKIKTFGKNICFCGGLVINSVCLIYSFSTCTMSVSTLLWRKPCAGYGRLHWWKRYSEP